MLLLLTSLAHVVSTPNCSSTRLKGINDKKRKIKSERILRKIFLGFRRYRAEPASDDGYSAKSENRHEENCKGIDRPFANKIIAKIKSRCLRTLLRQPPIYALPRFPHQNSGKKLQTVPTLAMTILTTNKIQHTTLSPLPTTNSLPTPSIKCL